MLRPQIFYNRALRAYAWPVQGIFSTAGRKRRCKSTLRPRCLARRPIFSAVAGFDFPDLPFELLRTVQVKVEGRATCREKGTCDHFNYKKG